jgi:hypothetical protein
VPGEGRGQCGLAVKRGRQPRAAVAARAATACNTRSPRVGGCGSRLLALGAAHPCSPCSAAAGDGHGALHNAAVRGAVDELQLLLSEGADIEARTPG